MKNLILILTLILFFISSNVGAQGQFVDVGLHANFTGYNLIFAYSKKVGKSEFSLGLKYLFKNPTGQFDQKGFEHKFHPDNAIEHWGINADFRHFYNIKGSEAKLGWFYNIQLTKSAVDMLQLLPASADTFIFEPFHSFPIATVGNNIGLVMQVPLNENVLFCTGIGAGINVWGLSKNQTLQWTINGPTVFAEIKVNLNRFKKH